MILISGNIFYPNSYEPEIGNPDAIVIPTNGFVKIDGRAVMGRGLAKQAAEKWCDLSELLGEKILSKGNHVHLFNINAEYLIITFPVKPKGELIKQDKSNVVKHKRSSIHSGIVPGWACVARLDLIDRSTKELVDLSNEKNIKKIIIPRVGCGFGELDWNDVKPILNKYLNDRFFCISM